MDRSVALIRSRCRERRLNKRLRSRFVLFKLTTDRHEASRGPFATAELLVDIPHGFLINMLLRVGFSRCLQVLVHWCGFHAARGESEWCILLWCLAAQTVAARHLSSCWRLLLPSASRVHKSTELLWHKTPNFTPEVASQQTRPQFCSLQIIESHSGMRLWETARDVKHRWWVVVINRMIF